MDSDSLTFPVIFWTVFSSVIIYRRQNRLRGLETGQDFGPGWPEKFFVICVFMMVIEEIVEYISEKLSRGKKNADVEKNPTHIDQNKIEEMLPEQGDMQESADPVLPEPVRGGGTKEPESSMTLPPEPMRGGAEGKTAEEKKDAPEGEKPDDKKKGSQGEEIQLMVRWKNVVTEYSIKEVRERIKLRSPLSVLHAGPDAKHMHIEELVTSFRKCQLQRNSIFVVDEFDNLVPLVLAVDKWNEVKTLLTHLEMDESGEPKYDVISSDGLAYLYFKDAELPPLKRSIDYVMSLVSVAKMLKDGFKVTDEGGTKTLTLTEINDIFERSEMYACTGNCWIPLTPDRVEAFTSQYPQVYWADKWWLATPAILDWIVSDPTIQSQFDLKAAIEKVKNEKGPHVGEPRNKAVPFPANKPKDDGAAIPAPLEKK